QPNAGSPPLRYHQRDVLSQPRRQLEPTSTPLAQLISSPEYPQESTSTRNRGATYRRFQKCNAAPQCNHIEPAALMPGDQSLYTSRDGPGALVIPNRKRACHQPSRSTAAFRPRDLGPNATSLSADPTMP